MSHNNQPSYGEVIDLAEEAHHAMKLSILRGDLADARKWSITEDAYRYYAQSLTGAAIEVPVNNGYFPGATGQWIGRYNPS